MTYCIPHELLLKYGYSLLNAEISGIEQNFTKKFKSSGATKIYHQNI